ncbi:MAG: hypothetical protein ABI549_08045 [Flavobacterium sp.]|uniref:hypothetical protein n=1 Tax=Flavobacterium sp. TaxID=239 RepID=UPI003265F82F
MQKSTILFLISLLFLVTSCATNKLEKELKSVTLETTVYNAPYFANPEIDYAYKANISVYGNDMSGIFIAKKINATTHRVVFTTEFGNKLLDFEISETDFKVNSIVDELNRKILINTLKADFRLLLKNQFLIKEQLEDIENKVYKSEDRNKFNYLFISKTNGKLFKILHSTKRKEQINIAFTSENNTFAENIIIQHYNIKLRIELNYLETN